MSHKNSIHIRQVITREELRLFVDYPNVLYKGVEQVIILSASTSSVFTCAMHADASSFGLSFRAEHIFSAISRPNYAKSKARFI